MLGAVGKGLGASAAATERPQIGITLSPTTDDRKTALSSDALMHSHRIIEQRFGGGRGSHRHTTPMSSHPYQYVLIGEAPARS
jgi:hypothetical protein